MPSVIPTTEAADRLGCTPQAIINAVKRGDLNGQKVGRVWIVHDDDALATYTVPETGGRAHAAYRQRAEADGGPA
ncbi:helix-turn-helix domain-containing protein [Rubrivirga sp.]|uniref:helix-turn-helix domain-containing protein n=1 Tax=Rubrivirga sp. TaxID=1885344 RepID=UPI003B52700C